MKSVFLITLALHLPALAIEAKDQRLLESLIKQGIICEDQNTSELQDSLQIYLSRKFSKTSPTGEYHKENDDSNDCISVKE
jgi:hypothetical protein